MRSHTPRVPLRCVCVCVCVCAASPHINHCSLNNAVATDAPLCPEGGPSDLQHQLNSSMFLNATVDREAS